MTDQPTSLAAILHQLKVGISLSSKAPYPIFDDSVVGYAFDQAKNALERLLIQERIDGQIEALESAFRMAEPDTNIVTTGKIQFMIDGCTDRIAELQSQLTKGKE